MHIRKFFKLHHNIVRLFRFDIIRLHHNIVRFFPRIAKRSILENSLRILGHIDVCKTFYQHRRVKNIVTFRRNCKTIVSLCVEIFIVKFSGKAESFLGSCFPCFDTFCSSGCYILQARLLRIHLDTDFQTAL